MLEIHLREGSLRFNLWINNVGKNVKGEAEF